MLHSTKVERWSLAIAGLLFAAACDGVRAPMQPGSARVNSTSMLDASDPNHQPPGQAACNYRSRGQPSTACVALSSVSAPTALTIGGLEGRVAVSASNNGRASVSGLLVQASLNQGATRRSAGSSAPFSCDPGPCTIPAGPSSVPDGQFNVVASNDFPGTGTLRCGPATTEVDLMQDGTLSQSVTAPTTLSHAGGCVRPEGASLSPTTLQLDGLEGTATVTVQNDSMGPASDLLVQGWIVQGSARRAAGNSAPFTCAPGSCVQQFNFVANNALPGTGTLLCGAATAEFDLMQGHTPRRQATIAIALSHTGGCVRPESAALSPTTLEIGGLEGTATVTVENDTTAPISDLVVQGWIVQGTARRAAGNSAPFTCATGSCVQQFNFVANNDFPGTGTLVCGSATAEFDLMQGQTPRRKTEIPITLSKRGGCP